MPIKVVLNLIIWGRVSHLKSGPHYLVVAQMKKQGRWKESKEILLFVCLLSHLLARSSIPLVLNPTSSRFQCRLKTSPSPGILRTLELDWDSIDNTYGEVAQYVTRIHGGPNPFSSCLGSKVWGGSQGLVLLKDPFIVTRTISLELLLLLRPPQPLSGPDL